MKSEVCGSGCPVVLLGGQASSTALVSLLVLTSQATQTTPDLTFLGV